MFSVSPRQFPAFGIYTRRREFNSREDKIGSVHSPRELQLRASARHGVHIHAVNETNSIHGLLNASMMSRLRRRILAGYVMCATRRRCGLLFPLGKLPLAKYRTNRRSMIAITLNSAPFDGSPRGSRPGRFIRSGDDGKEECSWWNLAT